MKIIRTTATVLGILFLALNFTACNSQTAKDAASAPASASSQSENASPQSENESSQRENGKNSVQPAFTNVDTGALLGYKEDSTYTFLGIPYAQAGRYEMPKPVAKWKGLHTAQHYGEICPNGSTFVSQADFLTRSGVNNIPNENSCLNLNVWTQSLDTAAKKPVVFWIHGGGYSSGSSCDLAYYEGKNLSQSGDVVFVSINHRLNALGFLDLSAYGEKYKNTGNLGMADIVAALQWVKKNIGQFGGDPNHVTIVGQSGGGGKVLTLMGLPAAQGLFKNAVSESPANFVQTKKEAQAQTKMVMKALGLTEAAVDQIKDIPYSQLLAACTEANVNFCPVVDGDYYPQATVTNGAFVPLAKNIPLIIGGTFSEFHTNLAGMSANAEGLTDNASQEVSADIFSSYYKPNMTDEKIKELLKANYGDQTDAIIAAFKKAYPSHDLFDLMYFDDTNNPVLSHHVFITLARQKAAQGGAPVYFSIYAYDFPIFGGVTPFHTGGDLPFLLDNVDKIAYMVKGDEVNAQKVAKAASSALISFAYTGNPSTKTLKWDRFTDEDQATMIFDTDSQVRSAPEAQLLKLINSTTKKSSSK